jgi:hypothetical protein
VPFLRLLRRDSIVGLSRWRQLAHGCVEATKLYGSKEQLPKPVVQLLEADELIGESVMDVDGRYSKAVMDQIQELEAKAAAERDEIAKLGDLAAARLRLADPEEIMTKVFQIEELVGTNPASGREALRRLHSDGRITLELGADGVWRAKSDVLPGVLVLEAQKVPGVSSRDLYASVVAGAAFADALRLEGSTIL